MDIVKRAYLRIKEKMEHDQDTWEFHKRVRGEVIRLIKVRAYSGHDWPREFGPIPEEIKAKRKGTKVEVASWKNVTKNQPHQNWKP